MYATLQYARIFACCVLYCSFLSFYLIPVSLVCTVIQKRNPNLFTISLMHRYVNNADEHYLFIFPLKQKVHFYFSNNFIKISVTHTYTQNPVLGSYLQIEQSTIKKCYLDAHEPLPA
ncbi:hypothetical protein KIL84_019953 [Mauremys mutica]|uniref:Uncharacterized protein n=1 Tax=Mauremys mutica TaxID=74926 RepID=A0A9D3XUS1_9SAUR|nr:hypothetical protein KIL84_019953 [Mauremys mutica]